MRMSFWSENYSFIKDVYDTRVTKMVEWMDNVEMAITKVMATKVYTSAEFKRERDNFLSLIKNMEKQETKKWLEEVKETLFRDRNQDERKDEYARLEDVLEKHHNLIPKVSETQVKSEVFWKCYEYGDDLIQIFEFIDDQRAKSVRDVIIGDTDATEELMDKHASIMRIMENKRKTVEEFIGKGERMLEDPKSPMFLENHVNKLKEAWEVAQQKAGERRDALVDNLEAWKVFEMKKVECDKSLESAEKHFKTIKRIYDLEKGPADLAEKIKIAACMRAEIEDSFGQLDKANDTLQIFLPLEMKDGMHAQVKAHRERLPVMEDTDKSLAELFKFNQDLADFDKNLTTLQTWVSGKASDRLQAIREHQDAALPPDPEEKCGKVMELLEDTAKKVNLCKQLEDKRDDMFPKEGTKMPKDAKDFLERLKKLREDLNKMQMDLDAEFQKFSGDVRFFAEYQTGLQEFYPRLVEAEEKIAVGLDQPGTLAEAQQLLADIKAFQSSLEDLTKVLESTRDTAKKMSHHQHADSTIESFKGRWENVFAASKQWVACINDLVDCWVQLEAKIHELTDWVVSSKSQEPEQGGLSIERLEEQLNILKESFRNKQVLVEDMNRQCRGVVDAVRSKQSINVRRMTMLPVEEVRKLSGVLEPTPAPADNYPDAPVVEGTVVVPPPPAQEE